MSVVKTQQQDKKDKSRSKTRMGTKDVDTVWFNPELVKDEIKWLETHPDDLPELVFAFVFGLEEGDTMRLKHDVRARRWVAILFRDPTELRQTVLAVSVRAATASDAVVTLAYMHQTRYSGGYPTQLTLPGGRWG